LNLTRKILGLDRLKNLCYLLNLANTLNQTIWTEKGNKILLMSRD
jgi:hypothetical protein